MVQNLELCSRGSSEMKLICQINFFQSHLVLVISLSACYYWTESTSILNRTMFFLASSTLIFPDSREDFSLIHDRTKREQLSIKSVLVYTNRCNEFSLKQEIFLTCLRTHISWAMNSGLHLSQQLDTCSRQTLPPTHSQPTISSCPSDHCSKPIHWIDARIKLDSSYHLCAFGRDSLATSCAPIPTRHRIT